MIITFSFHCFIVCFVFIEASKVTETEATSIAENEMVTSPTDAVTSFIDALPIMFTTSSQVELLAISIGVVFGVVSLVLVILLLVYLVYSRKKKVRWVQV